MDGAGWSFVRGIAEGIADHPHIHRTGAHHDEPLVLVNHYCGVLVDADAQHSWVLSDRLEQREIRPRSAKCCR
jgi:hypothetical protein